MNQGTTFRMSDCRHADCPKRPEDRYLLRVMEKIKM